MRNNDVASSVSRLTTGLFCIVLTAACLPISLNAQPVQLGSSSRYLVSSDGSPCFMSGDAAWSLFVQVSTSDAEVYLKNRQQLGFNVIIVSLIEHYYCTSPPKNYYGVAPFSGTTFSTPNEAYFAHVDTVMDLAEKYGITVLLAPLYLGYQCASEGWCSEVSAASDSALMIWGKYVGNRYKDRPNIVWVIGGDVDPTSVKSKVLVFVNALRAVDTVHVMTAHNARNSEAIDPWSGQAWLTLNNVYSGSSALYTQCKTAYNVSPSMPFFLVEGYYENEYSMTEQKLRAQAYYTVLGGGCGHVFGNNPVWFFSYSNADWKSALNDTGSVCMSYLQSLFNARHWYKLVPDYSNSAITSGFGTWGSSNYVMAAYASDSTTIIAYLPTSRTVTVNTGHLGADSIQCWWYNPTTGAYSSGGRFASGTYSLTPGSAGDWVLVVDRVQDSTKTSSSSSSASRADVPARVGLLEAFPNPFNPSVTIRYRLSAPCSATLRVLDLLGRTVATLVEGWQAGGMHEIEFEGSNLATGMYLCRLSGAGQTETLKILLLR